MPQSDVKGLFLDLDGTLADSMPVMAQVYHDFLARLGRQGSPADFEAVVGLTLLDTVKRLKDRHDLPQPPLALLELYNDLVDQVYVTHARPFPGARELLTAARRRGIFTAVVTSATRRVPELWLERNRLEDLVMTVVAADDVTRGKPDPQPYRLALDLAGIAPPQGLAVEDSPNGARAAIAAGIPTWVVGPPGRRPAVPGAAGYADGLEDLLALI